MSARVVFVVLLVLAVAATVAGGCKKTSGPAVSGAELGGRVEGKSFSADEVAKAKAAADAKARGN